MFRIQKVKNKIKPYVSVVHNEQTRLPSYYPNNAYVYYIFLTNPNYVASEPSQFVRQYPYYGALW